MVGIADLFASSAPQAQPVQNATQQAFGQQDQNAQNLLRQTQAGQSAQDIVQKQRQMQLSMLNGVLALPPEKQQDALDNIVPMMNRMGSTQYDIKTPEQAKMLVMSQVPAAEIPTFALNQQMANVANTVQNRLAGNAQPNQSPSPTGGTPMPQGAPMPANGVINPNGVAPVPSGGGQVIDPTTLSMMATLPGYDKAAQTINEIQNQSPQGQANIEAAKKQGENTAEAQKNALDANEGYQQVKQTIESLKNLINDPNLPQSKYGLPAKGQAWASQNFGDQKTADAYNTFATINESQTINAIRNLAQTGQIRMTKTLENIINRGYLVDPDVSTQAKMQQANAVETELENSAIAAQNVASRMSGGQGNTPYKAPYTAPQGTPMPQNSNQQFKSVEDVGAALKSGKISPVQAQMYWSQMGIK